MPASHFTAAGNYQNLFVAKLPLSVSDGELMAVFAPYTPSSATVMLDPVTGRSKGYAFVLFANADDGRQAAAALDKTTATVFRANAFSFDLTIFASKHSGKEVAAENECLYIRNIPNSWPMADVEAFIARHGKPVYSAVRSDHLGSPVWVVFVEYDCVESARATLKAVHGMSVAPRCPPILAKFAENEDVKRNRRDRKAGRVHRASDGEKASSSKAQRTRRIDVSHQMHRPCHATHYDGNCGPAPSTTSASSSAAHAQSQHQQQPHQPVQQQRMATIVVNYQQQDADDVGAEENVTVSLPNAPAPISPTHSATYSGPAPMMMMSLAAAGCSVSESDDHHHDHHDISSCNGSSTCSKLDDSHSSRPFVQLSSSSASNNNNSSHLRYRHNPYSCESTIVVFIC